MSADDPRRPAATAAAVVSLLGADVRRVVGDGDPPLAAPAPIATAGRGMVTFCTAGGERGLEMVRASTASLVICGPGLDVDAAASPERVLVVVDEPRLSFVRVVDAFYAAPLPSGIHPSAVVHPEAKLGDGVYVGPFAYVGRCSVGAGSVIHGRVYLYDGVRVGRKVVVHAGTVIGADGFGYHRNEAGELEKFPHLGGVVIEDDVEIGANTCIDRGTLGDTVIREGAKIDNLVHIAHNVVVGRHAAVIAHAMVGGSTRIGDGAWVAPCACLRDGLEVGDRATVGIGALVVKSVGDDATVMGAPAREAGEFRALQGRLNGMVRGQG